ncbi:hypothetical protein OsJ_13665 [Oryza sativa Japonica Group]|uniref:DUF4220 domain-containing protein n=1 Tax=Oryza sativa subsp. japonica TaxID=39947 RepID=B9FDH7_ORYSJ|nr:hypothetical protein OsJ_13665 [Oryza sativa Japonica Group]
MAGGLAQLWKEWQIQILIILSFTLQVILHLLSWIRRHKGYKVLRIILWLSYLSADSTAIYTLGQLSMTTSSSSREHLLNAFWATFLLLHLGGPDNITAYSLEDNQLWLRHLLTFTVQVLGVAYVLYRYIAGSRTLVEAIILMFAVGVVKYGKRVWAFMCANMDSIRSSLDFLDDSSAHNPYLEQARKERMNRDLKQALLGAHYMFDFCKSLFVDALSMSEPQRSAVDRRDAYHIVDFAVTYALLIGAILLEITTLLRTVGSSWTCAFLHTRKWDWPCNSVMFTRQIVKAGRSRLWLDSIGQYNLLDFCTRDMTDLRGRIAMKVGLENWFNKLHYSNTTSISSDIKEFVLKEIQKRGRGDIRNARRMCILYENKMDEELSWSTVDIDFEKSILVWHVATDVYLCCFKEEVEHTEKPVVKVIKEISNYMLYLLLQHPDMLPGPIRIGLYPKVCASLVELWQEHSTSSSEGGDNNRSKSKKLASLLFQKFGSESTDNEHGQVYLDGTAVAGYLLRNECNVPNMLGLIAGVWFEMLCYAAHHCSEESHARQLSTGGEFLTAVWLLVEHIKFPKSEDDGGPSHVSTEISQQQLDNVV